MRNDSCAIIPPLSLEYFEAKIQMLSAFSWKKFLALSYMCVCMYVCVYV